MQTFIKDLLDKYKQDRQLILIALAGSYLMTVTLFLFSNLAIDLFIWKDTGNINAFKQIPEYIDQIQQKKKSGTKKTKRGN